VHDRTKLFASTIRTLQAVFASVHRYPSGEGEVIVVATPEPAPDAETLRVRAAALQEKFRLRFALPNLVARRSEASDTAGAELLTDDFAPADLYNAVRD